MSMTQITSGNASAPAAFQLTQVWVTGLPPIENGESQHVDENGELITVVKKDVRLYKGVEIPRATVSVQLVEYETDANGKRIPDPTDEGRSKVSKRETHKVIALGAVAVAELEALALCKGDQISCIGYPNIASMEVFEDIKTHEKYDSAREKLINEFTLVLNSATGGIERLNVTSRANQRKAVTGQMDMLLGLMQHGHTLETMPIAKISSAEAPATSGDFVANMVAQQQAQATEPTEQKAKRVFGRRKVEDI